MYVDILLSEEAPEADYEYVNPVHVVLIDVDKDEAATTSPSSSLSSPPTSPCWMTDNNTADQASRPEQAANTYYVPPSHSAAAGPSRVRPKPVLLPRMPTATQTATATSKETKRRGPPVPPRKKILSTSEGVRQSLDREGYLKCVIMPTTTRDDVEESRLEPPSLPRHVPGSHGSRCRRLVNCRQRSNSVDSLLNWQTAASSLSGSEPEIGSRPRADSPPPLFKPERSIVRSTSLKFRGDLGLVPTNIASLSVEEVDTFFIYNYVVGYLSKQIQRSTELEQYNYICIYLF